MHNLKKYDDIINKSGDMEKISKNNELNYKLYCKVHEVDPEMLKWIKLEKRELANGETIDEDMILEVLPKIKWTTEETNSVKMQKGWTCDDINFNFMANYYHNKFGENISDEDILTMAHIESPYGYHYWKIAKMLKK